MTKIVEVESGREVEITRRDALEVVVDTLQGEFSEGDPVETPDGTGVVSAVWEESWEDDGETIEASEDSPAYTVALLEGGFGHYSEDELSDGELPDVDDVEEPVADLAQDNMSANVGVDTLDFNAPESWEESERPVRVIALDVWSSMGGQFDCGGGACCKGTMRQAGMSERASDEFCASFKDFILGTERWRGFGPD